MKLLTFLWANLLFIFSAQSQTLSWAKQLGGTSRDVGYSIAVDGLGNVYTTGAFKGTADFDPGPGVADLTSAGEEDIFISKLNAAGNLIWVKQFSGSSIDIGRGIAADAAGNVYITGSFRGITDFDPGPATQKFGSKGGWDIFIAKLDPSGNLLWATQYGDISDDYGNAITVDAAGNVYTTGSFGGTIDFDPGILVFNLTAKPHDIFVSKLNSSGKLVWAKNWSTDFTVQGNGIAVDAAGNV
ncbi:MAG TPA: SBBP repeat-containing protein, partial [Niastella sp.]|nr:SBBP repeat-containing protein [Niastella sp.]